MATDPLRRYFELASPTFIGPGQGRFGGPRQGDMYVAWNRLSKAFAVTLPQQLDRARVNRNRFLSAVR